MNPHQQSLQPSGNRDTELVKEVQRPLARHQDQLPTTDVGPGVLVPPLGLLPQLLLWILSEWITQLKALVSPWLKWGLWWRPIPCSLMQTTKSLAVEKSWWIIVLPSSFSTYVNRCSKYHLPKIAQLLNHSSSRLHPRFAVCRAAFQGLYISYHI